jgi:hypothetical protein
LKVLFLSQPMGLGGLETLTLRLAQHPGEHQFYFLIGEQKIKNALSEALKKAAPDLIDDVKLLKIIFFIDRNRKLKNRFKKMSLNEVDVIYSFNIEGFLQAHYLKQHYFKNAKLVTGVYHPTAYAWHSRYSSYLQKISLRLLQETPKENIIFMSKPVADSHHRLMQLDFSSSPICPLMVDVRRFNAVQRSPRAFKIISIGRICDFKTYNFTMLDVVKRLHEIDSRFEYHIYGHGKQEAHLQKMISEKALEEFVFFHGPVEYADFPKVLEDAYVFVGCGTAMIEAAAAHVPAIVACCGEPEKAVSYGWFHASNDYNLGEHNLLKQKHAIFDFIFALSQSEPQIYEEYAALSKAKADEFSIDVIMDQFVQYLDTARPTLTKVSFFELFRVYSSIVWNRFKEKLRFYSPYAKRFAMIDPKSGQ